MAAEPFATEQRRRTRWKLRTARGRTAEAAMREQTAKLDLLLRRVGYIQMAVEDINDRAASAGNAGVTVPGSQDTVPKSSACAEPGRAD